MFCSIGRKRSLARTRAVYLLLRKHVHVFGKRVHADIGGSGRDRNPHIHSCDPADGYHFIEPESSCRLSAENVSLAELPQPLQSLDDNTLRLASQISCSVDSLQHPLPHGRDSCKRQLRSRLSRGSVQRIRIGERRILLSNTSRNFCADEEIVAAASIRTTQRCEQKAPALPGPSHGLVNHHSCCNNKSLRV